MNNEKNLTIVGSLIRVLAVSLLIYFIFSLAIIFFVVGSTQVKWITIIVAAVLSVNAIRFIIRISKYLVLKKCYTHGERDKVEFSELIFKRKGQRNTRVYYAIVKDPLSSKTRKIQVLDKYRTLEFVEKYVGKSLPVVRLGKTIGIDYDTISNQDGDKNSED